MGNSQGKPVVFTDEVNLNHFRLLRVVGKGAFGKVRIVERKDSGLTFALKYIRKDEDLEYLYIVVDLMNGGDLRFHISRKCFTEDAVRFWISELGCALRYIHRQGIVHRDLKPDNVLLDSEGHVHLADFNVASDFKPNGKLLNSKSGTLAYLAPEVYAGVGYMCEVDWWSLGVTFYECIYGKRPFEGRSQDSLGEKIMNTNPKLHVTNPAVSVPCLRAMAALMEKDRSKRIGASGFETFTNHPFFARIDFEALEQKLIDPIFVPSSEKTNFDATYDLEELLLEEAPLEARARRQKPRAELKDDATAKEIREDELHRIIETMFEPFDYTTVSFDGNAAAALAAKNGQEGSLPSTTGSTQPSQPGSPNGSPPLRVERSTSRSNPAGQFQPIGESQNPPESDSTSPPQGPTTSTEYQGVPPPPPPAPSASYNRPLPSAPQRGGTRKMSKGGGVQMVLDESSSWSELANHSSTLPAEGYEGLVGKEKANSGVLGFLSRKKGRDRSPKPTEPGVLGKEGARQIIN
ncbi:hypothetical protein FQN54_001468 [Arachnomyces sp. PD_36]|nr:hypothetical protein FQN54_001468 [Arachnomyces sp. PD_36]